MYDRLLRRLSRVTVSGRFIPEIDGLRFIAIAIVVIGHIWIYVLVQSELATRGTPVLTGASLELYSHLTCASKWGVNLFFAISGFILALPFVEHVFRNGRPVSIRNYFVRRLTRLEPPYLINLIVLLVLTILFNRRGHTTSQLFESFLASSVYQHWLVFGVLPPINFVTWSLEVEIQFYCLVPLLACVFLVRNSLPRRLILVGAMLGLALVQQVPLLEESPRFHLSVAAFGQYFLGGFLLADLYVNAWNSRPSRSAWWDVVAALGWPALFVVAEIDHVRDFVEPFLIVLLMISTLKGYLFRSLLIKREVTVVGGMCYTIYLWHMAIISLIGRFQGLWKITDSLWVHLALATVEFSIAILIISSVLFVLIERPCMNRDWPNALLAWFQQKRTVSSKPA